MAALRGSFTRVEEARRARAVRNCRDSHTSLLTTDQVFAVLKEWLPMDLSFQTGRATEIKSVRDALADFRVESSPFLVESLCGSCLFLTRPSSSSSLRASAPA